MKTICPIRFWSLKAAFLAAALPALGDPLDHWTLIPSGTTNHLRSVAFGGSRFVAVGDFGTVVTSSDGTAWTSVATGITNSLYGVTHGQGRFVAVGKSGAILTSSDGATWLWANSGTVNALNAIAWTELGFVAVGDSGRILSSEDGSHWKLQTSGTPAKLVGVGTGFGKTFVGASANPPALFWSTNGSAWYAVTNGPLANRPDLFNGGFACGNNVLLGIRSRGEFYRSLNGLDWTHLSSPFVYCFGLAYARSQFVVVGGDYSVGGRTIGTSTNGSDWQLRYFKSNEGRLLGVAYGQHRFVAVGDNGSILASDPLLRLSHPAVLADNFTMTLHGDPGSTYHIQTTTNIWGSSWKEIGVVTNIGDTVEFIAPCSPDVPQTFYRVTAE